MSDSPGGAARGKGERVQQTVSDTIDGTKTVAAGVYNQAADRPSNKPPGSAT
jgi:hypothetical protein